MSQTTDTKEKFFLEEIKSIIKENSGLVFDLYRENSLKKKILKRVKILNLSSIKSYLSYLKKNVLSNNYSEVETIISELTVNETSFFRDFKQYKFLEKYVSNHFQNKSKLNILCIGCATGEEPYSIAMTLLELFQNNNKSFDILACDIDKQALSLKMKYVKDSFRLQNVPKNYMNKYFDFQNNYYTIKSDLNKYIVFKYFNIVNDIITNKYDVIFFKNVIMYFDMNTKINVINKAFKSLNDNGIIFFGITEIISDLPNNIKKVSAEKCNVFKKFSYYSKNNLINNNKKYHSKHDTMSRTKDIIPLPSKDYPISLLKSATQDNKTKSYIYNNLHSTNDYNQKSAASIHSGFSNVSHNEESVKPSTNLFKSSSIDKYVLIQLKGNIDEELSNEDYKKFYNLINSIIEHEKKPVVFDFNELVFISRNSIEKLLKVSSILNKNLCQIFFVVPNDSWKSYLKRMNISNNILILDSLDEVNLIFKYKT